MSQVWLKVSAGGGITSQFIILLQNILFGSDKIPNGPLYVDKGDILKRLYTDYLIYLIGGMRFLIKKKIIQ